MLFCNVFYVLGLIGLEFKKNNEHSSPTLCLNVVCLDFCLHRPQTQMVQPSIIGSDLSFPNRISFLNTFLYSFLLCQIRRHFWCLPQGLEDNLAQPWLNHKSKKELHSLAGWANRNKGFPTKNKRRKRQQSQRKSTLEKWYWKEPRFQDISWAEEQRSQEDGTHAPIICRKLRSVRARDFSDLLSAPRSPYHHASPPCLCSSSAPCPWALWQQPSPCSWPHASWLLPKVRWKISSARTSHNISVRSWARPGWHNLWDFRAA